MIVSLILLILGILAGIIGSLVGLGGGILIVPALTYLAEIMPAFHLVTPQVAIGTSLFVIIFTGLSSSLSYMKYKLVDYKSGLIFLSALVREALWGHMFQEVFIPNRFPYGSASL